MGWISRSESAQRASVSQRDHHRPPERVLASTTSQERPGVLAFHEGIIEVAGNDGSTAGETHAAHSYSRATLGSSPYGSAYRRVPAGYPKDSSPATTRVPWCVPPEKSRPERQVRSATCRADTDSAALTSSCCRSEQEAGERCP